jgi:thiosulfate/3-mercaptopyruvate sulfurtransferase
MGLMASPLVSLEWWQQNADHVVLADVRHYLDGRSAWEAYRAGHLPGARFVDLERWLSQPADPSAGRHPLPDPETFAEGMRRIGLNQSGTLVAYDDTGGVIAARLVWMLRVTGHDARLLDGGLLAWKGPLASSDDPGEVQRGDFVASPWPQQHIVGVDELDANGALLLDARDADRFRGEHDPVDPRPGHIPGAHNLPCRSNLNPDGTLLPVAELRQHFKDVGVRTGAEVISYCGSGVTACHNLLALEHAGFQPGRLFPGSYSQYSRSERPVATGEG